MLDLLGAGVGGDDAIEVRGERDRGLAIAGAAIPRQPPRRRDGGEPAEQLGGILRAMPRVVARELREVVFELALSLPPDQGKKYVANSRKSSVCVDVSGTSSGEPLNVTVPPSLMFSSPIATRASTVSRFDAAGKL